MKKDTRKYYSRLTGRMEVGIPRNERMSPCELAAHLQRMEKKDGVVCPVCSGDKTAGYEVCYLCYRKGIRFSRETALQLGKKRNEELARKAALPRKNQKLGRFISKICAPKGTKF